MAIWHLIPVDLDDPSWEASSHRGPAVIRAKNEGDAREIAQKAFGVKTGFRPQHRVIAPPWKRAARASGRSRRSRSASGALFDPLKLRD
jgi:hypothetical protein